jgi:hypothetical protein
MIESKRPTRANLRSEKEGVSFYTPRVLEKNAFLIVQPALFYQLSLQLRHLGQFVLSGITVAE